MCMVAAHSITSAQLAVAALRLQAQTQLQYQMGLQGYVGNAADQARIRRLEQERQDEKERLEKAKAASAAKPAGFRQWEHGASEVVETAFKQETVGLVTRDEYIQKKSTIQARLEARPAMVQLVSARVQHQHAMLYLACTITVACGTRLIGVSRGVYKAVRACRTRRTSARGRKRQQSQKRVLANSLPRRPCNAKPSCPLLMMRMVKVTMMVATCTHQQQML